MGDHSFGFYHDGRLIEGWDTPTIAVQTIGGTAPTWTRRLGPSLPFAEVIIVRSAGAMSDRMGVDASLRFAAHDEQLSLSGTLPAALRISAAEGDLDLVAEALARFLNGRELLVGADLLDLKLLISAAPQPLAQASAIRWSRWDPPSLAKKVRLSLNSLTSWGFGGGMLLIALAGPIGARGFNIWTFDDLVSAIKWPSDAVVTAAPEATSSAIVLIGLVAGNLPADK